MNTKIIKLPEVEEIAEALKWPARLLEPLAVFIVLLLLWIFTPNWLEQSTQTQALAYPNIMPLVILSLLSFLVIAGLCWWLLHRCWMAMGVQEIKLINSQFKKLSAWQQLSFYWLSFALLLLGALSCLNSIC